jgi:hypothetical protein
MSKKTLLEESTVRKFMKFANIGHLAESYLDEAGMYEEEEDEMLPPEAGMEDEMTMEPEGEMGMEPAEGEMGMEDEMPAEEGAMGTGEKEQMLADVVAAVAETLGVEAAVEGASEEMAPEGEEAMDDFAPADEEMPAPEGEEMPAEEEEEPMMEMAHEDDEEVVEGVEMEMDEESVVQETIKRVTARLKAMKETRKKEDLVESITSRIIAALKSKK